MKTSKEVMVSVLRKAADNLANELDGGHGIEYDCGGSWECKEGFTFHADSIYRIKPETITLKNGVTIPKPLGIDELSSENYYYYPYCSTVEFQATNKGYIELNGIKYFYATKEQAIEASKALFGIE